MHRGPDGWGQDRWAGQVGQAGGVRQVGRQVGQDRWGRTGGQDRGQKCGRRAPVCSPAGPGLVPPKSPRVDKAWQAQPRVQGAGGAPSVCLSVRR